MHRDDVPDNLEIINLGSGYARFAFDYSYIAQKGYNFAQSPQSLYYDYALLKEYENKLSKGCVVLINLPIFIFCFFNYKGKKYEIKYYGELSKDKIYHYNAIKKLIYTKLPVLVSGSKVLHIIWDNKKEHDFDSSICTISKDNIESYVLNHYNVWKKQFALLNTTNKASAQHLKGEMEKVKEILNEIIVFCRVNEWIPVLITTPLCRQLNEMFSEEFLDEILYNNIRAVNQYNVPYLDLRCQPEFQDDYNMYWNGVDWLSATGRKKFMALLMEKLKKIDLS